MEYPTELTSSEVPDPTTERRYREMLEQSESARQRGEHWAAQKLATEAHKWAMDERIRLQRLAQARKALTAATRRLETSWDKDRECKTVEELRERHPEFKSVIANWEKAVELVEELQEAPATEAETKKS